MPPRAGADVVLLERYNHLGGLSTGGLVPKTMDRYLGQHFDYVITVCDRAAESCPVFPGAPERIHWSFPDPAAATGTPDEQQRAFDTVASELAGRLRLWLSLPAVAARLSERRSGAR